MRTLLRLDASAQVAHSHSRALADYYEARWRRGHPDCEVLTRDLVRDPVPHLDEATIAAFYDGGDAGAGPVPPGLAVSDQLIGELKRADDVLISSAVYNFNMPSALKAWIDHIVRFGHTIAFGKKGPIGLLTGKRACLITARGGSRLRGPDYQLPTLQAVLAYVGIREAGNIHLEGTRSPDGELDARIAQARADIDGLFEASDD
ncbi:MAG: NAD(P)H-dependent oxidoreductase [Nannocystaceae bacterium]|nr:NAD(P)H-dependent oxidoreductase [Nannocystaceae bacterium]